MPAGRDLSVQPEPPWTGWASRAHAELGLLQEPVPGKYGRPGRVLRTTGAQDPDVSPSLVEGRVFPAASSPGSAVPAGGSTTFAIAAAT